LTATTAGHRVPSAPCQRLVHARSRRGSCRRPFRLGFAQRHSARQLLDVLDALEALPAGELRCGARQADARARRRESTACPTASRSFRSAGGRDGRRSTGLCREPPLPVSVNRPAARLALFLELPSPARCRPDRRLDVVAPSRFGVSDGGETSVQRTQMMTRICIGMHLRLAGYLAMRGRRTERAPRSRSRGPRRLPGGARGSRRRRAWPRIAGPAAREGRGASPVRVGSDPPRSGLR
jgi:hypothetical protein